MAFIKEFAQSHIDLIQRNDRINPALYEKYSVKRGLRDVDGDGVLAGLRIFPGLSRRKMSMEGSRPVVVSFGIEVIESTN